MATKLKKEQKRPHAAAMVLAFARWDAARLSATEGLSYKLLVVADAAGFHVRLVGQSQLDLDHDRTIYGCEPIGSARSPAELPAILNRGLALIRERNAGNKKDRRIREDG